MSTSPESKSRGLFNFLSEILAPDSSIQTNKKTVIEIEILPTLDKVTVTLFLDPLQWPPFHSFTIKHEDLEAWADEKMLLEADGTTVHIDEAGEYYEQGTTEIVSYVDFITEFITPQDAIDYLTDKKLIMPNEYQYAKGCK